MPSLAQLIVWIVMGLVGGSLAGLIITRDRKGFGLVRNMGLGLAGAIVGGLLFRLLGLLPGLDQISISLRDVVAAFVWIAHCPRGNLALAAFREIVVTPGSNRCRSAPNHFQGGRSR
jgi:uncharacterized membrane protein YeaQ/YmgE (transglycosylase-associated protein family)